MDWRAYVIEQYVDHQRATSDIGKELGKNPKLIRDVLVKARIPLRGHSAAQKILCDTGRAPICGPKTEEMKERISDSLKDYWGGLSAEEQAAERDRRSKEAKKNWQSKTDDEKKDVKKHLGKISKGLSNQGSKLENRIATILSEHFKLERRSTSVIYPYEVDIWLTDHRIAIEIDGPTHFSPIYGEENLGRVRNRDQIKDAAILALKIPLIRCRDSTTGYSLASCKRICEDILSLVDKLVQEKPKPSVYYLYIK